VVGHTSDYLTVVDGHPLPAVAFGTPTSVTATSCFSNPNRINGIRLIAPKAARPAAVPGVWEVVVRGELPMRTTTE